MNLIKKIEYQDLDREDMCVLYLIREAFLNEKAGVYLTNKCLRQLLPTSSRVSGKSIDTFVKRVGRLFPYHKVVRWNAVNELILGVTDKAYDNHVRVECLPSPEKMLEMLGFKAKKWPLMG